MPLAAHGIPGATPDMPRYKLEGYKAFQARLTTYTSSGKEWHLLWECRWKERVLFQRTPVRCHASVMLVERRADGGKYAPCKVDYSRHNTSYIVRPPPVAPASLHVCHLFRMLWCPCFEYPALRNLDPRSKIAGRLLREILDS